MGDPISTEAGGPEVAGLRSTVPLRSSAGQGIAPGEFMGPNAQISGQGLSSMVEPQRETSDGGGHHPCPEDLVTCGVFGIPTFIHEAGASMEMVQDFMISNHYCLVMVS